MANKAQAAQGHPFVRHIHDHRLAEKMNPRLKCHVPDGNRGGRSSIVGRTSVLDRRGLPDIDVPTRDRRWEARSHVHVWNERAVRVSMPPAERGETGRSAGVGG